MDRKKGGYFSREKNTINRNKVVYILEKVRKRILENIVRETHLECVARSLATCNFYIIN